jgi:hypothetical protein
MTICICHDTIQNGSITQKKNFRQIPHELRWENFSSTGKAGGFQVQGQPEVHRDIIPQITSNQSSKQTQE